MRRPPPLAGLAEGLWGSLDELAGLWTEDRTFAPSVPATDTRPARQAGYGPSSAPGTGPEMAETRTPPISVKPAPATRGRPVRP